MTLSYVTHWDPDFNKFQQEIEHCHLDWRKIIHLNVDLTFSNLITYFRVVGSLLDWYFNVLLFSNAREKVLILVETRGKICLIVLLLYRTFSPGLTNNHTLKFWSDNFSTTRIYVVKLEYCRNNLSMNVCSLIQGNRFKFLFKLYEARISECNLLILIPSDTSWIKPCGFSGLKVHTLHCTLYISNKFLSLLILQ